MLNVKEIDNIEELENLIERAKLHRKELKRVEGEKNRNRLLGLKEGHKVRVIFKGNEMDAEFVAITNSRFTVKIGESKKSIMFDKLVKVH